MDEALTRKDLKGLEQKLEALSVEQRRSTIDIIDKIGGSTEEIIATVFLASRTIRQEIQYQTMLLKILEDNLSEIQFGGDTGISSKIEVSVGAEIFGTGAKWILDVDTGKASYKEILEAIQQASGIPSKIREKARSKLQKFLKPS